MAIRIITYALLFNQQVQNRYVYTVAGGIPEISDLAAIAVAFDTTVLAKIAVLQSASLTYQMLTVEDLDTGLLFESASTRVGAISTATAECPGAFVSWAFQLVRATRFTRHGWKRLGGVTENFFTQSSLEAVKALPEVIDVQNALLGILTAGTPELTLTPVIPKFSKITGDLLGFNQIADCKFRYFSTQNSRKVGRGI